MRYKPKPESMFTVIARRTYRSIKRAVNYVLQLVTFSKACAFVAVSALLLTISLEHFSEAVHEYAHTGHSQGMILWFVVVLFLLHDLTHIAHDIRHTVYTAVQIKWQTRLYVRRNRYAMRNRRRRWRRGYVVVRYIRRRARRILT